MPVGKFWIRWLLLLPLLLCSAGLQAQAVRVEISQGLISGVQQDGWVTFKGIPYAQAPVGHLRWAAPEPRAVHSGIFDASRQGPACLQTLATNSTVATSEDCLNLNVWTPAVDDHKRPVMVWIHGGGLRAGSNAVAGEAFAQRGQVVVAINYRLGPLGFFSHEALSEKSANPAVLDMVLALHWVQDNIQSFGGDPEQVTIFGVSAGGMAVNLLMATEASAGLFHRAIAQSGYATWALPRSRGAALPAPRDMDLTRAAPAEALASELVAKVDPTAQTAQRLYALDGQELVDALVGFQLPIVDGTTLTAEPGQIFRAGQQHAVPYMSGGNSHEGTVMRASRITLDDYAAMLGDDLDATQRLYATDFAVSRELGLSRMFGDNRYLLSARVLASAMAEADQPAWLYYVDFVPPSRQASWRGTPHGMDAYLLFAGLASEAAVTRKMVERMRGYWSNFARTGDPNGAGLETWPKYRRETDQWLVFGAQDEVRSAVLKDKLDLLEKRYLRRLGEQP